MRACTAYYEAVQWPSPHKQCSRLVCAHRWARADASGTAPRQADAPHDGRVSALGARNRGVHPVRPPMQTLMPHSVHCGLALQHRVTITVIVGIGRVDALGRCCGGRGLGTRAAQQPPMLGLTGQALAKKPGAGQA